MKYVRFYLTVRLAPSYIIGHIYTVGVIIRRHLLTMSSMNFYGFLHNTIQIIAATTSHSFTVAYQLLHHDDCTIMNYEIITNRRPRLLLQISSILLFLYIIAST